MASPSVTYTFSNSTTADATQVNQNFTDIINGLTDGTKDLSISALTCAGNVTFNGNATLGNASGDDITFTGSLASTIPIKTTNTYNFGSSTKGLQYIYYGSSAGSNTTRVGGSAVTSDVQLILPDASGTLKILGDTQAKTTTYTALRTDGVIKCDTTSGWTLTLPAASGNTGLELFIIKTTNDFNLLTIDGNGSETINGVTTTTLNTQYESVRIRCDGSNWLIVNRYIPSLWTSYTPTWVGLGTVSNSSWHWKRVGDEVLVRGKVTAGTTTATECRLPLPTGLTSVDTTPLPTIQIAGPPCIYAHSTTLDFVPLIEPSVTYLTFGKVSSGAFTKINGNALAATGQTLSLHARVPVSGWNG